MVLLMILLGSVIWLLCSVGLALGVGRTVQIAEQRRGRRWVGMAGTVRRSVVAHQGENR